MTFTNWIISITLNNKTYTIHYSYRNNMTFQDLLEYFAYLCPELNICQCYHFQGINPDKKIIHISKCNRLSDFTYYFRNIILYKDGDKCQHSGNKNNLYFNSKLDIISEYSNQIKNLQKDINDKIKDIENKIKDVENLKKEKNSLIDIINGDFKKMKLAKESNLVNEKFEYNGGGMIQIMATQDQKFTDFYDVIIHIDSITGLNDGWKIEMNEKGENNYSNYKKECVLKIGVIGNANKGKSFILSKLSKMNLPSGVNIKTEGLSIKYPDLKLYKGRKIVLLDSAGLETPVLVSDVDQKNLDKNERFKEKSREKLITELFLQNYIINNSNILLVVVDSLSFSEQKLLMKVKKEMERSKINIPLFIIHNLKTFTTKLQVKDYIENTLKKSATFELKQGEIVLLDIIEETEQVYYYKEIGGEKKQEIYHFIYANETSEEVNIYNKYFLNFIQKSIETNSNLEPFDIIETIKKRYIEISKDIIEKKEKDENLTIESFDNDPKSIKFKNKKDIILKRCLIDELGFSNFKANGFEPKYNIYKKDKNKIIVKVEVPGNSTIEPTIQMNGEYNLIKLTGEKMKDKEPDNLDNNIFNIREIGRFNLEIPLKMSEYRLKLKNPIITRAKGILSLEYDLETYDCNNEEVKIIDVKEI